MSASRPWGPTGPPEVSRKRVSAAWPRVLPVGDRALTVQLGDALDETTVARVRALDTRLASRRVGGVLEAVPTYAALLVLYDPRVRPFAELARELTALCADLDPREGSGRLVEFEVFYDGEDLDEVARTCGLKRDDVIDRHSGRDYAVMMLGFSPGFAYMGFVDEGLRVPRRKTPRTRVPAGAVAIAGPQTGIYPRVLPGGWNLLGATNATLFDPRDEESPSRLLPGDRVRFRPVAALGERAPIADSRYAGHDVTVTEAGLLTLVQDAGRTGRRRVAVPGAGFADTRAAARANRAVGNALGHAAIELCSPGLRLTFHRATFVALSGREPEAVLERADFQGGRMAMPRDVAVRVRPGNTLTVTSLGSGARAFVAIAGLLAPTLLGSASVDRASGLLRPLSDGDGFDVRAVDADRIPREAPRGEATRTTVRVILGPQADHFDAANIEAFLGAAWRTGLDSDRVGARLDGPRLHHAGASEIVSDGMVPGCIQVPPDGRPIVMLADCPTTGGYPKIGCVVSDDLPLVAQAIPGRTPIRFEAVNVEDVLYRS